MAPWDFRPGLSELLWAFRKNNSLEEFPVYLDDDPFQLYERILAERKNDMRSADVVLMPHYMVLRLEKEGLLEPRESKESHAYPSRFQSRKSLWYAAATTFMSMVFDSKRLSPADLPESLEDLMESPFVSQLGLQSLTASKSGNLGVHYLALLKSKVGQKRWDAFRSALQASGFDLGSPGSIAHPTEKEMDAVERIYTERHFPDLLELAEAMLEYDKQFWLWRNHHMGMVERVIGRKPGTGVELVKNAIGPYSFDSSEVSYLKTTLRRRFYPALWAARGRLPES